VEGRRSVPLFGATSFAHYQDIQDAFLCLNVVENTVWYREAVDKTYPRNPKYRVQGFPKDAFHIACAAHRTRIKNILCAPGIDAIEKNFSNSGSPICRSRKTATLKNREGLWRADPLPNKV